MEGISTVEVVLMIINILLAIVAWLATIVGKNLTQAVNELRKTDNMLIEKFEQYARRDDLQDIKSQLGGIFKRLEDVKDITSEKVSREELHRLLSELKLEIRHGGK